MKRKLGEIGKITAQTVIIIALIAVVGYFVYNQYVTPPEKDRARIDLYIWLENEDIVPLTKTTTFRVEPLGLFWGTAQIKGIKGILSVAPVVSTTESLTVNLGWTTWDLTFSGPSTIPKISGGRPGDGGSAPTGTTTNFSSYWLSTSYADFSGKSPGSYILTWTASGNATANSPTVGTLSAPWSTTTTATVTWTQDTLTINPGIGVTSFGVLK
jgi:hypothetical protein